MQQPSDPIDGSRKVYFEIYHETSSGDFGIEIADGPLLRCHTHVLQGTPGFIGKVRERGKILSRSVEDDGPTTSKDYFKAHGLARLLEDSDFVQFTQPLEHSALTNTNLLERKNPLAPGFSTRTLIGGTTSAVKRRDQFFLAERYEVDCDTERMCELLRYIYQGVCSYFEIKPNTDSEKAMLTDKMLKVFKESEKFSVDGLFERLLKWFGHECFWIVGERNFADAFYHLQHYEMQCTEEHSRAALIKTVTGDMLVVRDQFHAVTMDPRWNFLPVEFVEETLSFDGMPIGSETEVLNLIERWNANADKPQDQIVRLLCCFRPDEETRQTLVTWLTGLGWLKSDGSIADMPGLAPLKSILSGHASKKKQPRKNLSSSQLEEALRNEDELAEVAKKQAESGSTFVHYRGMHPVGKGCSFGIGAADRLLQAEPIRNAGIQRLRVVLSNPRRALWDPEHEVFVGISYGEGKYFGYLVSATAFSGIFSVRAIASAAPAPNAPVHLTGSGNKIEFDMGLEVQLQRVNLIVTCKLSVIWANATLTEELFQVTLETLKDREGLRYQVVATGLNDESVDVSLSLISGGANIVEEELDIGPNAFVD